MTRRSYEHSSHRTVERPKSPNSVMEIPRKVTGVLTSAVARKKEDLASGA
jgi:hypothetical protein